MKTCKIVGTALLGAAFAVAAAGTASASTVPGLPDPVGQLTSPLESATGSLGAGDKGDQAQPLSQLGPVTSVLPVDALPL
ncbi:hypothetical protein [Streptomyces sp. B8F3]|uniref:hypothetical protein n=1 Tax=unclassified Streptomyces TaxID=2593676 RepID=UPI00325E858E